MCVHHRAKPNTERISKTLQEKNTKTPVQIKKQNKTKLNPHNQLRHNSRFPPKWLPAPCGSLRQEKRCRKALMQPPGTAARRCGQQGRVPTSCACRAGCTAALPAGPGPSRVPGCTSYPRALSWVNCTATQSSNCGAAQRASRWQELLALLPFL